jgi:integrase
VDGQVVESDGKTENAQHVLALDPFTLAVLKAHTEHPDTITRRFKKLAAAAGLPKIDLHDVRHSYATAGRDAKIDWKALSQRIGHSDVAFTMKQYVQADPEADCQVAITLAELIIGGSLASMEIGTSQGAA